MKKYLLLLVLILSTLVVKDAKASMPNVDGVYKFEKINFYDISDCNWMESQEFKSCSRQCRFNMNPKAPLMCLAECMIDASNDRISCIFEAQQNKYMDIYTY